MNCKTCKHFTPYRSRFDKKHYGAWAGTCESEKFTHSEDSKPPKDGFRYWDYGGYSAGFDVGEDFGCIHHEVKK